MKPLLFVIAFLLFSFTQRQVQPSAPVSKKAMAAWARKRTWSNGLKLKLHSSVNLDSFYMAYHRNKAIWDAAFAFLRDSNLVEMKTGRYPIVGEQVFATISEAPSHNKEDVKWESHKKYVDLQYIIRGKEMIGVADTSKAIITKPYTDDAINYTADGKYYIASQDAFFLFFPCDAHRPTIKVQGFDLVKKIVIKIQTAATE